MNRLIFILGILFFSQLAFGQYQIGLIPRVSPDKGDFQRIGFTAVDIRYGSPSVSHREIWGNLVPWDKVWRAGANNATTVEFSTDVLVEGEPLGKGKYSFFIVPQKNKKWIAIFNKQHEQWGAFDYSKDEDAIRIEILPVFNNAFQEELEYTINSYGFQFGSFTLAWEYLKINIDFDTDYVNQFKNEIESRIEKADKNLQWVTYLQGAEHLEDINTELEVAEEWINKSEVLSKEVTDWNKQFYPQSYIKGHLHWTKAKIMSRKGDYKSALEQVEKMKEADEKSLFYNRKNESQGIDEKINTWTKKNATEHKG